MAHGLSPQCLSTLIHQPSSGLRSYDQLRTDKLPRVRALRQDGFAALHQASLPEASVQDVPAVADHVIFVNLRRFVRSRAWIGGRELSLAAAPGHVAILPAGVRSYWQIAGEEGEVVHLHLAPDCIAALMPEEAPTGDLGLRPRLGVDDAVIAQIARNCLAELSEPLPACALMLQSHALALAARLLRVHGRRATAGRAAIHCDATARLARARDYIEMNLGADIGLVDIAAAAGLSVAHFSRGFRAMHGKSPHRYVVERRIARAQRLMADPEQSLARIARACGFASQPHFSRCFALVTGMPPGRWRRMALPGCP
ncbi:MAG: hypothetical protein A4S12_09965 [Proteobacteria bacterium SG_bin5]|nr:AraC family transcriptional regulator [Sphingomonas sp.]OQW40605.1 MAG: hypothetical protein A4S12_09965 [Proteobacteria bacterium SG_bin5]